MAVMFFHRSSYTNINKMYKRVIINIYPSVGSHLIYNLFMDTGKYTFREKLAVSLRANRGQRSQTEFAKKLAISQSTLARIEAANQNVSIDRLELICKRLKCSLSDLIPDS